MDRSPEGQGKVIIMDDRNDAEGLVEEMTEEEKEAQYAEVEALLIAEGERAGREAKERGSGIVGPSEPWEGDPFEGC